MTTSLKDIMSTLEPARRKRIERQADRLHGEYLTLKELRRAKALTQVNLAETLGVKQATVAQMERRSDLLLSTLRSYVEAMGGSLKLLVEFPDRKPVVLDHLGDTEETALKPKRATKDTHPA